MELANGLTHPSVTGYQEVLDFIGYSLTSMDIDVEDNFAEDDAFDTSSHAVEAAKREAYRGVFEDGLTKCTIKVEFVTYEGDVTGDNVREEKYIVSYTKGDDLPVVEKV